VKHGSPCAACPEYADLSRQNDALVKALYGMVEEHGRRRGSPADELLPASEQDPEIAAAMRALGMEPRP
jgi:hypothetical protein